MLTHSDLKRALGAAALEFPFAAKGRLQSAPAGEPDRLFILAAGGLYNGNWDRRAGAAGKQLSSTILPVPAVLLKARAPEINGISKYGDLSDNAMQHVLKEPKRTTTELNMYYDVFRFKHLGVVLAENRDLQLEQGIRMLQDVAENRGFA